MKKVIRKSLSVILLALAIVVTQVPTAEVEADYSQASEFQMNGDTLVKYLGTASTVSIPASVVKIGEEAFTGNISVKKVTIGSNVETIAYRAFADCSELKEIIISDSVTEIGNGAFSNCTALKKISFSKNLEKIGKGIFAGCQSLEKLTVSKDNTNFVVADGALYDKAKTKLYFVLPVSKSDSFSMPTTVTDIAEYAFWGCSNIKYVSLSSNLKEIPEYAFSNCKALQSVAIPYSVTRIDLMAFADCIRLATVSVPPTVNEIHETAFDGCPRLNIAADIGTYAYNYFINWKKTHENQIEYEDTGYIDTESEEEIFVPTEPEGVSQEKGIVLGSSHVVGNRAVVFIDNSVTKVLGSKAPENSSEETPSQEDEAENIIASLNNQKSISIPKYTIAWDTIIADKAFYQSSDIKSYEITEGITQIGEFAFSRSNISSIEIPEGVTEIGYGAFYHCDDLRDVKIPKTVSKIAPKAFDKSLWMENWLAGGKEEYLIVGDGILLAYRGSGGVITIPNNVKQIAPEVFKNNIRIGSVNLPDSLKRIGEDAFSGCKNLNYISGGKYVEEIADGAFAGCILETFHVTSSIKTIGLKTIDYSDTNRSVSQKVVVFEHTENLPVISYEETATRLSSEENRGLVLEDVLFAIVDKTMTVEKLAGTVLDSEAYGFRGIVAYISSKENGIVKALSSNLTMEELENTYIPEYIYIDKKAYKLEGVDKIVSYAKERENTIVQGEITVINEAEVLSKDAKVSAILEGNDSFYYLKLIDSEEANESIKRGYQAVYKEKLPQVAISFDMILVDKLSGVSLTKLGNAKLAVTMQLPLAMQNQSVRVVTVDSNGQLESISFRYVKDGYITFETNHVSAVSVYLASGHVVEGGMDASPDTGENIHPKWFWAIGLFSLAVLVFFSKPRNYKSKK